ncbi:hydrogenase 2 maturation protease [Roseovarius sp. A-2]|uniref:hydrogenase maturation protease n=1 Tax=Roseovarius sp. A-2 TaxID=1570360 RepID=UPI0009B55510|nr:hydrogenase maturation protease [Roseovarius sp. A-2]GAW34860.1 hydrogenase 2 maturation protease [Roseovarius sp. A-2]
MPPDVVVIGCGNPNRSDDGAGPHLIARMREHGVPEHTRIFDGGTDGMSVMYSARGATHLIIVDARVPDGNPGAIFEVPGEVLEAPPKQSLNLHDFRWDHALFAGRRIYGEDFPGDVSVFLIEAATLELGLGLSAAVSHATEAVETRIRELIKGWSCA